MTLSSIEDAGTAAASCPKHMVYGPCGGVRPGGGCELDDRPCPFVSRPVVVWDGPLASGGDARLVSDAGTPLVITDLRVRPYDRRSIDQVVARLGPTSDAILVGEHHNRPDFPPSQMAGFVTAAGGTPWVTLSCRDRNRVVLEQELAALAELGAPGVHCVTGDARAATVRTDATQVFDLDSTRLTALARRSGLDASVAATPAAPPQALRPARIVEKQRAGAQLCFVNHAGGSDAVGEFVAAARAAGATLGFIACVAVYTDAESLAVLDRFPGLVVDPRVRDAVMHASDRRAAGIEAAIAEAQRMLTIAGVVGVNLSGSACAGPEHESAEIMATVANEVRGATSAT